MAASPLWSYSRKKSISKSQPCSYWHIILLSPLSTLPHPCQRETEILWWVTQCLGAQKYDGEEAHLVLPAAWSQRCKGPTLSNSSAAPADADTEHNFMASIQTGIRPFKKAHKQQLTNFTKNGALRGLGGKDEPGNGLLMKGMWKCGDTLKAPTFPPCCLRSCCPLWHITQLQEDTAPDQQMEHAQLG